MHFSPTLPTSEPTHIKENSPLRLHQYPEWSNKQVPADIALVNVPYGTKGKSMRPLGLAYLGAYLNSRGFVAHGFDFSHDLSSPHDLVQNFKLYKYPVVGISFYNVNAKIAYRMACAIKELNSHCIVIAGGPHPSARHETLFEQHPEIDIVVRDEGEETCLELLQALKHGASIIDVKGITYHDKQEIIIQEARGRVEALDDLPPPQFEFRGESDPKPVVFYDRELKRLKPALGLVSSRSCPYNCNFCAIILIGREWRKASPQKIVDDLRAMEDYKQAKYEHLYFLDANFFVKGSRTLEVAKAISEYRPGITFSFSTRVNQLIRGKALLKELREFGLRAVELGIESGSREALKRMAKDTTVEQNEQAVNLLREHNLELFMDFIMFDAESTLNDIEQNLDFLERMSLDNYVNWDHFFSVMTPYLGTEIRNHYESLLGLSFEADVLPKPRSLFVCSKVRSVFLEIDRFRRHIPKLTDTLQCLEDNLGDTWSASSARKTLNAVTIRRLLFMTLRNLLSQAQSGSKVDALTALPAFLDDRGRRHDLDEFLQNALQ